MPGLYLASQLEHSVSDSILTPNTNVSNLYHAKNLLWYCTFLNMEFSHSTLHLCELSIKCDDLIASSFHCPNAPDLIYSPITQTSGTNMEVSAPLRNNIEMEILLLMNHDYDQSQIYL